MSFALVLKSGKKMNVKKIELDSESKLCKMTQERMRQHEEEVAQEK